MRKRNADMFPASNAWPMPVVDLENLGGRGVECCAYAN